MNWSVFKLAIRDKFPRFFGWWDQHTDTQKWQYIAAFFATLVLLGVLL